MKTFESILDSLEMTGLKTDSIGTQQEKWIHQGIKYYLTDEPLMHEVKIEGYIVDVFMGGEIYEIQTGSMWKLVPKLNKLLLHYPVHVLYPLIQNKTIITLDEYGVIQSTHRSFKVGKLEHMALAIEPLFAFLNHHNFSFKVMMIDVVEYRRKSSFLNHRDSIERLPKNTPTIKDFKSVDDYRIFLPSQLDSPFTRLDYQKIVKVSASVAMAMMRLLLEVNLIEQIGLQGRYHLYVVR